MTTTRVLLVAHQYWPVPGSASQVLGGLVAHLCGEGAEVVVLTSRPDQDTKGNQIGPHGELIEFVGPPESDVNAMRRVLNLAAFARGVRRAARQLEFDVVISDPPPTAASAAASAARTHGVPFVYYLADSWGGAARGSRHRWIRGVAPAISFVEDRALVQARLVIAATHGMGRVAERAGSKNVHVVPNGIPLGMFTPAGEQWWPQDTRRPFFLYAGNAGVVHGAEIFCAAADELWQGGHDFDVVYMGYGSDTPLIDEAARKWPNRLFRVGLRPATEVAAASRTAIGALASLREVPQYADARPIKAMSGLASGTPVVYAGRGEFADEVSTHDLGFVSAWDVAGVVASMREALALSDDPDGLEALRSQCAAYARSNFDDRIAAASAAALVADAIDAERH